MRANHNYRAKLTTDRKVTACLWVDGPLYMTSLFRLLCCYERSTTIQIDKQAQKLKTYRYIPGGGHCDLDPRSAFFSRGLLPLNPHSASALPFCPLSPLAPARISRSEALEAPAPHSAGRPA